MLAAITTRYLPAIGSKGPRMIARSKAGRVIVGYDHSTDCTGNHRAVALELARRHGWSGRWAGGVLPANQGHAWVIVSMGSEELAETFEVDGSPE